MVAVEGQLQTIGALLDGLDVALCVFDEYDRTVVWNRAFLRFFPEHAGHIHRGEPYRSNLRRFYEGRLGAEEMASIERYIEEGLARHRGQQRPYEFKHRDRWVRVSSLPLPGVGRMRAWRQIAPPRLNDADEQLGESLAPPPEAQTEVFEHVGDGVMLTDAANRITWVNEHFVQLYALSDKSAAVNLQFDAVYRAAWHGHQGDDDASFEEGLSALKENMRYAGAPFELPLPGARWVRVVEQRRRDGVGFFAHVDISVLKQQQRELILAERRARESEALLAAKSRILEATLERMEQGVMMVGADQVIELCNRRAIELLDLPPELMAARPSSAEVLAYQWANDEFVDTPEDLRELVRNGTNLNQRRAYERQRPNGRVLEIETLPVEGGGVLRTYTDITERKRAEATKRELESRLLEAKKLEAIGTMARGIAHDFNNIVAAILGNSDLARQHVGGGHPVQANLAQIDIAGRRARSLVQQILAFSREEPNKFVGVALDEVVEEATTLLRAITGQAVQIRCELAPERLAVMGDATQLQQALLNLGTNSWQALRNGAGRIEFGLEKVVLANEDSGSQSPTLAPGSYAHLWVRDDGHGMDDSTKERIFEPFFTTKAVGKGTGLGLAVTHGIVAAHGGHISVTSSLSHGTTFDLYLPLVDIDLPVGSPDPVVHVDEEGDGQHVLYIDDDEVMALLVRALLERLGYRATCTLDAEEAIAIVRRDPEAVDLVITDFNMPKLSGLDVVRALSAIRPGLPVAISSGFVSEQLLETAVQLGVRAVMRKEHTLEELGQLVHDALIDAR